MVGDLVDDRVAHLLAHAVENLPLPLFGRGLLEWTLIEGDRVGRHQIVAAGALGQGDAPV